jgi:hypothetical protein
MKSLLRSLVLCSTLGLAQLSVFAASDVPSYLDFSDITPAKAGQFVEVDLDQGLLSMAARLAQTQEKEVAEVIRGLKSIHVRVIGLDDANRAAVLERVRSARTKLSNDGWRRIAVARDGSGQDVAVFARTQGEEMIQGLAVTVIDGEKEAVVVNIVGDIRPEQIAILGARFGVDPLKKIQVAAK